MTDHRVAVAQEFLQRSFRDDHDAAMELLDAEVTYRIPGLQRFAGTFYGPDAVARQLRHFREFTDNTIDVLKWEDWMSGVNHVAALVDIRIQHESSMLTYQAIFQFTLTPESKIRAIEVFFSDQHAIERFFPAQSHPSEGSS